ncbi:MAG: hypothetical protein GY699_18280 [Desulfobacteraceae bacterium]|nr:hypothetical protein [Desulfobacteraceae bacterium]
MKKYAAFFLTVLLILTFTGCGPLSPKPVPLGSYDMVPVISKTPVALINAQEPGLTMIKVGAGEKETDLTLWAGQAISLTASWLNQYHVPVNNEAAKKLKVSIVDPTIDTKSLPCTLLTMNVETGNGITKQFAVKGCAGGYNRSVGYAISYAVIEMMRSPEILAYISDK